MPVPEENKFYKDIGLNDDVTVTIPVCVVIGFLVEYSGAEWKAENANVVVAALVGQVVKPSVLAEKQAEHAIQEEKHKMMHEQMEGLIMRGQAFPFNLGGGDSA